MTDVIVGKGEILVNRKESAKAVIEKQEGLLIVDTASRATVLSADSIGGMLIVEKQNESSAYRPILLKLVLMKVKGKGFCNVFTYEDLVTNGVHPQESVVSVNGTLKLSYAVGKGKYILYDQQGQSVGAGFTCPNTQSKLFSGERTSPLQTKRQYYPHFDTTQAMGYISCYIQYNGYLLKT